MCPYWQFKWLRLCELEASAPVFCIVEAKDNDIKRGLPQCVGQLLGAKIFNDQAGTDLKYIFGAVTTGDIWLLLKLEGNTMYLDNKRHYVTKSDELLGTLQSVVNQFV